MVLEALMDISWLVYISYGRWMYLGPSPFTPLARDPCHDMLCTYYQVQSLHVLHYDVDQESWSQKTGFLCYLCHLLAVYGQPYSLSALSTLSAIWAITACSQMGYEG
jgi:hypothetical protein